jgi:hypothetical protein
MKAHRLTGWIVTAGAAIGLFFAYRVITDLRSAVDDGGAGIPGVTHIVLCWPVLLALIAPATLPRPIFYAIIALLNALTFPLFGFIFETILFSFSSRGEAATEATNEL